MYEAMRTFPACPSTLQWQNRKGSREKEVISYDGFSPRLFENDFHKPSTKTSNTLKFKDNVG